MTPAEQLASALEQLWRRYWPLTQERLRLVDDAIETLRRHELSQEQRVEAASAAHKLAGSLGSFGIASGTRDARAIEQALLANHVPLQADTLRNLFDALSAAIDAKQAALAPVPVSDRSGGADPEIE